MSGLKKKNSRQKLLVTIAAGIVAGLLISSITIQNIEDCVFVGERCYKLEKVEDEQSRIRGLSGRESLAEDEGMLFVFDNPGPQCMWMKEMSFSLDMIWLDGGGKVVHMAENISPDTYPRNFCSESSARYVIELNRGSIGGARLQIGDSVVVN